MPGHAPAACGFVQVGLPETGPQSGSGDSRNRRCHQATGFWKSISEVESFWRAERRFEPKMPAATRERFFGEWKAAVARARG
jgi:hypothetical protein